MSWEARLGTHRFRDGNLATAGRSRVEWASITPSGRVHHVENVIVRWNFLGGTPEKPDVTFVLTCGPQRHAVIPRPQHDALARCARCDSKLSKAQPVTGP